MEALPIGSTDVEGKELPSKKECFSRYCFPSYWPQDKPDSAPRREEWMTELPPEIKPSGIGARKFRTTTFDPGDRSVWTDTPADRERRAREGREGEGRRQASTRKKPESVSVSARDRDLAEKTEEYNVGLWCFVWPPNPPYRYHSVSVFLSASYPGFPHAHRTIYVVCLQKTWLLCVYLVTEE